jgi:hypothetical protein
MIHLFEWKAIAEKNIKGFAYACASLIRGGKFMSQLRGRHELALLSARCDRSAVRPIGFAETGADSICSEAGDSGTRQESAHRAQAGLMG